MKNKLPTTYEVIKFALSHHKDQKYGSKPYLFHLKYVADNVNKIVKLTNDKNKYFNYPELKNDSEKLNIIAYFHDLLEDTNCSELEIFEFCKNNEIVEAVKLLTKQKENFDYNLYIENIKTNNLARIVKIADTLSNLECSIIDCNIRLIKKYNKQLSLLTV